MKPIVFDFFCGLGGWSEAFIAEGYDAIGFDIEAHDYGSGGYPGKLVLRDIRQINGAELVKTYGVPTCIVASPPCQEFSYMAMPWSKAKEKMRKILADPEEQKRLCELFNECFRIQREVCEAAGHYVPMVVENVRGAQRWVGRARWNFGSFYLWGDVPALMPIPAKRVIKNKGSMTPGEQRWCRDGIAPLAVEGMKLPEGNASERLWKDRPIARLCDAVKGEAHKTAGMNWSDPELRGKNVHGIPGRRKGVSFTDAAGYAHGVKVSSETGRRTDIGKGARFTSRNCGAEGVKGNWLQKPDPITGKRPLVGQRATGSKSKARKQASAEIAKIPYVLASWIARCFLKGVEK